VRSGGRTNGVDGDLKRAVGAVLESNCKAGGQRRVQQKRNEKKAHLVQTFPRLQEGFEVSSGSEKLGEEAAYQARGESGIRWLTRRSMLALPSVWENP
jgi:hypothetical protein